MKKTVLTVGLVAVMLLSSCGNNAQINLPSEEKNERARTEILFYEDTTSYDKNKNFTTEYDLDFDGVPEKIDIACRYINENEWESEIVYSVNDKSYKVDTAGGNINAVYACDVDVDDGVLDLAVITTEVSSDPVLRMLKYGETLTPYEFHAAWGGDSETYPHFNTGYVSKHYFNLNDDGTITIKTQTNSAGMWHVMRDFELDENGVFEEIERESYDIQPGFMDEVLSYNMLEDDEVPMWLKGYVKAHCDYNHGDISINEGEYFKVLKDNDESMVYIEKEDGSAGWINIDYDVDGRYDLNPAFFFLAG